MNFRIFGIISAAFFLSPGALSQSIDATHFEDNSSLREAFFQSAEYLSAAKSKSNGPMVIDWRMQFAGAYGREDLISSVTTKIIRQTCGPSVGDLESMVREEARRTRIVIVNEAHMLPMHRANIGTIAEWLAEEGYEYYAAETFQDEVPKRDTPARISDGFYTVDPVYGGLLNRLRDLDYSFVPYEARLPDRVDGDRMTLRERTQAENIKKRILDTNQSSKVLVHVGWGHVEENGNSNSTVWMASYLKKITNINPFTISQTACWADGADLNASTSVAKAGSAEPLTSVDLAIGSPKLKFHNGRPEVRLGETEKYVSIPESLIRSGETILTEAREVGSSPLDVPADRILNFSGEKLPLILKPGDYLVSSYSRAGQVGETTVVSVR